jgi:hypothetical protein
MDFNTPNKTANQGQIFRPILVPPFGQELSALSNTSKEYHPNDSKNEFDDQSSIAKLTQRSNNESLYSFLIPDRANQQ